MMNKTYKGSGRELVPVFAGIIGIVVIFLFVFIFYFNASRENKFILFESGILFFSAIFVIALAGIIVLYYLKKQIDSKSYTFKREGLEIVSGIKTKKRTLIPYNEITAVVLNRSQNYSEYIPLTVKTKNKGNFRISGLTREEEDEFKNFLVKKIKR